MAEIDHAPKQNMLKSRLLVGSVLGMSALTLATTTIDVAPSQPTAREQSAGQDYDQMDLYAAKHSFAEASIAQGTNPRAENASRAKNRELRPGAECWNGSIDDLNHVPKSRAKIALGNIAVACEIAKDEKWFKANPQKQMKCLVELWDRESGWYQKSGSPKRAYGIPQALPGSKMSEAGSDWATNPATQIKWGIPYISYRYGTPCEALQHHDNHNWY